MNPAPIAADYTAFLTEVKGRILTARFQAGRAVNRELVMLYWDIGRGGQQTIRRLSSPSATRCSRAIRRSAQVWKA